MIDVCTYALVDENDANIIAPTQRLERFFNYRYLRFYNERNNAWIDGLNSINESINESMNESMNESEWISEWKLMNACMNQWIDEWIN